MTQLFTQVLQFFQADGWPVTILEPETVFHTVFRGQHGEWNCFFLVQETFRQLAFYSVCPLTVPVAQRAVVAEFLMRRNYELHLGNFEVNFDSGELRYRTSLNLGPHDSTPELLRPLVYTNVLMMDQHLPSLMAVSYGQMSPLAALAQLESS